MLATEATDAAREWSRLRVILRFAIICGDVIEEGQDWQAWGPGGQPSGEARGIDRDRRVEYWDVLKALWQLKSNDPFGHELLRRHVGFHCEGTRCDPFGRSGIHWHSIGLLDLRNRGHSQEQLIERREGAMAFVVEHCRRRAQ